MSALQRSGIIIIIINYYCCNKVTLPVLGIYHYFRRSLRRGESVKYLVSDDVIAYIRQHNLYQVQIHD